MQNLIINCKSVLGKSKTNTIISNFRAICVKKRKARKKISDRRARRESGLGESGIDENTVQSTLGGTSRGLLTDVSRALRHNNSHCV